MVWRGSENRAEGARKGRDTKTVAVDECGYIAGEARGLKGRKKRGRYFWLRERENDERSVTVTTRCELW
jgi:hypothetical protein